MKASDLFIRCLENEGVEYIFGIPGEENLDVMDSMIGSKIKFITTRHEQGAALVAIRKLISIIQTWLNMPKASVQRVTG